MTQTNEQPTGPSNGHLSDADLVAYLHQTLSEPVRQSLDQHLETCADCRTRLDKHVGYARRLDETLKSQLAMVGPPRAANWGAIAGKVSRGRRWHRLGLSGRRPLLWAMGAAYLLALVIGGLLLFDYIRDFTARQEAVSLVEQKPQPSPTAVPGEIPPTLPPDVTPDATMALPPVWTGSERINLLLLGIDQRGQGGGPWRTDTMIILTVDPETKTAGMISIPRDLWVPIWAYDVENRINTAHYYGDARDYPGGGPALARDTVAYNLGIPIHHYVRLNFSAFETLVDEIGGIDVYVEKTINDRRYPDENYGYDPFYLEAGQHHLDGETALKYARSRHGTSDFDRAQRQQKVIQAIRDQVVQFDQLPRLISKAPSLLEQLGDAVRTDLTLEQVKMLAQLASTIPPENIHGAVIDQTYTLPYVTDTGAQVLIPLRAKIGELYESFFSE